MSIVVITTIGENKRFFINSLHKKTGGKIDLVIIQKKNPNQKSFLKGIWYLYKNVGALGLLKETYYSLLLRLRPSFRNALEYFRERSNRISKDKGYLPKTLEVNDVNSDEVFNVLEKLSPKLMLVWGNTILKPRIIKTSEKVINLHMGLCPYYRGAVANQYAVIGKHLRDIGATIHYVEEEVDSGDILKVITASKTGYPRELFRDLNDKAEDAYLDISYKLFLNQDLPRQKQDMSLGRNYMLKDWMPSVRYRLAGQIIRWEKTGVLK